MKIYSTLGLQRGGAPLSKPIGVHSFMGISIRHIAGLFLIALTYIILLSLTGLFKQMPLIRTLYKRKKRSPLKEPLLRPAGESLRQMITDIQTDFNLDVFAFVLLSFIIGFTIQIYSFPLGLIFGVYLIIAIVYTIKIKKRIELLRNYKLGYEGEIAVAQEINQLMHHGYYVYHDLPADGFNIDHIIIGPSGVYAVETKMHRKPVKKGSTFSSVDFDGNSLVFPDKRDKHFIQQARNQAKWLSAFLTKSVGKKVKVTPVLCLPGWYINYKVALDGDILIINPKMSLPLITKRPVVLDTQTIKQISFQIEQRCRTSEI
ncbi:MAG: NERD domain-containing protein [Nitrospirae bacterium]|nr:MAG: NERD domain-containing protein [Nitrospirota bacterium]